MGLRFNAPSSSGATGAAHNSDCHVGRRLLLPVTKKCSTLQSAMSRLRKGEMHVQFLSQEFIRLFTAGYRVLLWLEGFLKPFVCGMGSLFFLRLKLQARRTQLTQRFCFCVYIRFECALGMLLVYSRKTHQITGHNHHPVALSKCVAVILEVLPSLQRKPNDLQNMQ